MLCSMLLCCVHRALNMCSDTVSLKATEVLLLDYGRVACYSQAPFTLKATLHLQQNCLNLWNAADAPYAIVGHFH